MVETDPKPLGPRARVVPVGDLPEHGLVTSDIPVPAVALAVAAHPDDAEFGCGATLAKWAGAGCSVHHLILTDGSKGTWDPEEDPASLVARRQAEQRAAARALGGTDVSFLSYPDGELRNGVRTQWDVCRWIRLLQPDVVLGHDPWRRYRLHPDHRHAGFILTDALVAARDGSFFVDQKLPPHRPRELLLWEADEVNHVEDIGAFADVKVRALLAHESQLRTTMAIEGDPQGDGAPAVQMFRERILTQLADHGRVGGVPLGEAFHRLHDI